MNLAWRDVRHDLGRFLLTCLGLGLLLGVVLSMIGIYRGLVFDAVNVVRGVGADLWVVEPETRGPFAEASRIPGDTRELVARIHGVTAAGSLAFQTVETEHRGKKLRMLVVGYEPGRLGGPTDLVAGRGIARSRFEVVADEALGLVPGEQIRLGRDTFRVVGLVSGRVGSGGDPVLFMSLRDAQALQFELEPPAMRRERARGNGPAASTDVVNAVVARVAPHASPAMVVEALGRWKHLAAMTTAEQETILTTSVVERARRQIGLFTLVLLIVSGVIIALIVYTLTMDKIRAIATLKLIGAPDRTIVGLIVQEALALGVVGLATGAALITLVKDRFPRRIVLEAPDLAALALVVVLVCLLASGLGVRLALRVDPATALGS